MIHRRYVITPSVAVYGGLPLEILSQNQQQQVVACNAFLSRATYHGAELHVPTTFHFDVTEFAFELYKRRLISFEDSKILTQDDLGAAWEYHFPTTDDMLEVKREFPDLANTEYVALARNKDLYRCLICGGSQAPRRFAARVSLGNGWCVGFVPTDSAINFFDPELPIWSAQTRGRKQPKTLLEPRAWAGVIDITLPTCAETCDTILPMTQVLEQAIATLLTLPNEAQDSVIAKLLENIEEAKWNASFERPESEALMSKMAARIQQARKNGATQPIHCEPSNGV